MIHQTIISKEIYKDEAILFIAGRYKTSAENVLKSYIRQAGTKKDSLTKDGIGFILEDNKMRLIYDLIDFYNKK